MTNNNEISDEVLKVLKLADYSISKNFFAKREGAAIKYLKEAKDEINEAVLECKDKNAVYLEDELGDIFWDYLQAIKILERDGQIRSVENVFKNCFEKYSERLEILETDEIKSWEKKHGKEKVPPQWKEVKNKQKIRLKENHEKLYKN